MVTCRNVIELSAVEGGLCAKAYCKVLLYTEGSMLIQKNPKASGNLIPSKMHSGHVPKELLQ